MTGSDPVMHMLDVPGARLYYERRGTGPLLLLIGSPIDSTGFAGLASALAGRYTVVTYDPRGTGNSTRQDTAQDVTPGQQAEDVHRLLAVLGAGPADIFGSSGGAVVGLALVTAHPGQVRTLVAHEPPLIELLPDAAQLRAEIQDIYDTYQAGQPDQAMGKFMAHAGIENPAAKDENVPRWEPSPEEITRCGPPPATSSPACSARPPLTGPTSRPCGRPPRGSWSPPGPRRKDSSPTALPWHWPTSSAHRWPSSPVTTADSLPSPSHSARY